MANTFTNVVDTIFAQSLELLAANITTARTVRTDFSMEVAKPGQVINVPYAESASTSAYTAAQALPTPSNSTSDVKTITLNQWRKADMFLTDKEAAEVADIGLINSQAAERVYALGLELDAYLLGLYPAFYGYVGTAGTTPFASDLSAAAAANRVLNQQKAPLNDRYIVLDPLAEEKALGLSAIQNAQNRASSKGDADNTLRTAMIGRVLGFDWWMNQQVPQHTAGTITTGLIAKASTAVAAGQKSFVATTAASTGACALLAGDVIAINGHSQTYTLTANATQASAATDVTLSVEPGLEIALAGSEEITVKASHRVNLAYQRNAIGLAVRPLAPAGGFTGGNIYRSAIEPVTGIPLTLEISRAHGQVYWVWSLLYGASVLRPELGCRIAG